MKIDEEILEFVYMEEDIKNEEQFSLSQMEQIPSHQLIYKLMGENSEGDFLMLLRTIEENLPNNCEIDDAVILRRISFYKEKYGDEFVNNILTA